MVGKRAAAANDAERPDAPVDRASVAPAGLPRRTARDDGPQDDPDRSVASVRRAVPSSLRWGVLCGEHG